jgi:hypothetical protein
VPVIVLVKEGDSAADLHWKTLAGYDRNRFFFNNSGGDNDIDIPGVNVSRYNAPVGNDVDSDQEFWIKWTDGGEGITGAYLNKRTFFTLYPKDEGNPPGGVQWGGPARR